MPSASASPPAMLPTAQTTDAAHATEQARRTGCWDAADKARRREEEARAAQRPLVPSPTR